MIELRTAATALRLHVMALRVDAERYTRGFPDDVIRDVVPHALWELLDDVASALHAADAGAGDRCSNRDCAHQRCLLLDSLARVAERVQALVEYDAPITHEETPK